MSYRKETITSIPMEHDMLEAPPSKEAPKKLNNKMKLPKKKTAKETKPVNQQEKINTKSKFQSSTKKKRVTSDKKKPKEDVSTAVEKCTDALDLVFTELKPVLLKRFEKWAIAMHRNIERKERLIRTTGKLINNRDGKLIEGNSLKRMAELEDEIKKIKKEMKKRTKMEIGSLRVKEALEESKHLLKKTETKKQAKAMYAMFVPNPLTQEDVCVRCGADVEFKRHFADYVGFIETYHKLKKLSSKPKKAKELFKKLSEEEFVHTMLELSFETEQQDAIEEFFLWTVCAKDDDALLFPLMPNILVMEPLFDDELLRE